MNQTEYKQIIQNIIARSDEWKEIIEDKWNSLELDYNYQAEDSLLQHLLDLFDNTEMSDIEVYRKLQRDYNVHVAFECNEVAKCRRAHTILGVAYDLCEAIYKKLPLRINTLPSEQDFSLEKDQAVVRIYRHQNASIIEVMVKTDEIEAEELLYWSKDKIFIMSFAPEFDEYHPACPRPLTFL